MNSEAVTGPWAGGSGLRAAQVVLSAGWGEAPGKVPLRLVPGRWRSSRPDEREPTRPLRPVFSVRVGEDGALAVLADTEEDLRARRFLYRHPSGEVTSVQAGADAAANLTGWRVLDYRPDGDGGLHLLEFLEEAEDEWINRIRHVSAAGVTTWSRQGVVDFHHTDPRVLRGEYTGLHQGAGGRLWLAPKATTAGLVTIDPADGRTLATVPLDADISNLVISATDQAIYARMIQHQGQRAIALATTDLTTGQTTFSEPTTAPLLDLAGTDSQGRVCARDPAGLVLLDGAARPSWTLYPCGAVVAPRLVVANGTDFDLIRLREQDSGRTWSVQAEPIRGTVGTGTVRMVAVGEGPSFVFHVTADEHRPGRLVTTDADGQVLTAVDDPDTVSTTLATTESRIDVDQAAMTPSGAVLLPLSDPQGFKILRLDPEP